MAATTVAVEIQQGEKVHSVFVSHARCLAVPIDVFAVGFVVKTEPGGRQKKGRNSNPQNRRDA